MKKFMIIVVLAIIIIGFVGCSNVSNLARDNLSEIRYGVFDGKTEDAFANYMYGLRESNYEYDGKHTPNTEFGIISIKFTNKVGELKIPFTMQINNETITGELERNPFTSEYMVDIQKMITTENTIVVTVNTDTPIIITLENRSKDWKIDYEEALSIGINQLSDNFKKYKTSSGLSAECYIKIINDIHSSLDVYYWLFSFITTDGKTYSCVIDVNSGEILAIT